MTLQAWLFQQVSYKQSHCVCAMYILYYYKHKHKHKHKENLMEQQNVEMKGFLSKHYSDAIQKSTSLIFKTHTLIKMVEQQHNI